MTTSLPKLTEPTPASTSLATVATARWRSAMEQRGWSLSHDHMASVRQAMEQLAAQANGAASPSFTLCPLDPGMGKTELVVAFVQALLEDAQYAQAGILVAVFRKDEIRDYVARVGVPRADVAVLTADDALNTELSGPVRNDARILFTTHSMIARRTRKLGFIQRAEFHFQGQPRQVRVWDEACLPDAPLVLSRDDIAKLIGPYRRSHSLISYRLEHLFEQLKSVSDGEVIDVPELRPTDQLVAEGEVGTGITLNVEEDRIARVLTAMAGREALVRVSRYEQIHLLSAEQFVPDDFAPALILDASGRVRMTYSLWNSSRAGVDRLPTAPKYYSKLSVKVWERGAGKTAFRNDADRLLQPIAELINAEPLEQWLVVSHKLDLKPTLESQLKSRLAPEAAQRTAVINWGQHTATNAYKDARRVILAGITQYDDASLEGLWRAVSGTSHTVAVQTSSRADLMFGETCHHILQAVCRTAIRNSPTAPGEKVVAYLIGPAFRRLDEAASLCFPGATVETWTPYKLALAGRILEATVVLDELFNKNGETRVSKKSLRERLGIGKSALSANVLADSRFQDWLDEQEITMTTRGFERLEAPSGR